VTAGVVVLDRVTKRYGSVVALNDVSLSIDSGEVVALLGPNGAGKTTAISIMLGLRRPNSGTARLFGMAPTDLRARSRCGVMLQESGTPELLSVEEIIRLFGTYYPRHLPAAEAIRLAGLEEQAGTRLDRLSGGQRQRLFFALAVTGDPEVLFLDEPTVGMDVEGRRTFLAAIRQRVRAGTTVVLTTHYLEEADQLADRIVMFNRGTIVADAPPAAIKSRVAGKRLTLRFGSTPDPSTFADAPVTAVRIDGTTAWMLSSRPVDVVRQVLAVRDDLLDMEVGGADLEEAFVSLTGGPQDEVAAGG
jgi:ABC-2 type transport system ATP-binding protein